jgi:hypothetical protein
VFEAFRAAQKPTHVKFADGREGLEILLFLNFSVVVVVVGLLLCALGGRSFGGGACLVVFHVAPGYEAGRRIVHG